MHEARLIVKITSWLDDYDLCAQQRVVQYLVSRYGLPAAGGATLPDDDVVVSHGAIRMARYRASQREIFPQLRDGLGDGVGDESRDNLPIVVSSSSSSEAVQASKRDLRLEALEILAFLNEKTGRKFRPVPANLDLIRARLASGVTLFEAKGVIARKVRAWKSDEKMKEFLRPETLFNRTKFESYLGQREAE